MVYMGSVVVMWRGDGVDVRGDDVRSDGVWGGDGVGVMVEGVMVWGGVGMVM